MEMKEPAIGYCFFFGMAQYLSEPYESEVDQSNVSESQ